MRSFDAAVLDAARTEREVGLTTFGRISNEPARIIVWITVLDDQLYLRSGGGMGRDWTKNLAAHGKGILHLGDRDVPFTARHVTDLAEAKAVTAACAEKYVTNVSTAEEGVASPAETATFQLFPVEK